MLRKRGQTLTSTTPCNIQNVEAWPKARSISAQHLTTLLHDVATCVERGGQTHATFSSCQCSWTPGPWRARSGPSAHALMQQCCVNVAKRVQHHATSKMLHKKFDSFQI